jgi:hypothetical protein
VARGACIQAAAVLSGREVAAVALEWARSDPQLVEPHASVDAASVRDAYRTARLHAYPESGADA